MAETCQQKQSHTLDPFSCSLYFTCGSSGTIWKKHACVSWVLSSRCSALSAPQTLDSEETLDQKQALFHLKGSGIQTRWEAPHLSLRRLGRMSSSTLRRRLVQSAYSSNFQLYVHTFNFPPFEKSGAVYDYRVVRMNK